MRRNPYEKYLSKEDRMQNRVMAYLQNNYKDALSIHVPNEGRRSPFERFKFKYLGGVSGVPDILVFYKNASNIGLAIELKVGYNKPTENQKTILERLKKAGWSTHWSNSYDEVIELIDKYFKDEI